jgi:retron-type reverse transcriptase
MKRYGFLFEQICSIDNLMLAHKNAKKGKSHYRDVKKVESNLDIYIKNLQDMLLEGKFTTSKYKVFTKVDKGKERTFYSLPYYPDRIVQHAILQVLEPIWKPTLIRTTYQSIKGRGIHKARYDIEKDIKKYKPTHYLQIDIEKFYPSIDNGMMFKIATKKIKCPKTVALLKDIVFSLKGVPIGNYMSQYLGNLFLSELDHYVKETLKVKMYYRYCDDMVICINSIEEAIELLHEVEEFLKTLNLSVKENAKIAQVSSGIDFVGYVFTDKNVLLRKTIAKNYLHASKEKSLASYNGWVEHCNCNNLRNYKYGD